jgi:hypothetical protein
LDFRGNVSWSPHDAGAGVAIYEAPSVADVDEDSRALRSHEDVGRLDIPVHDRHATGGSTAVEQIECRRDGNECEEELLGYRRFQCPDPSVE